MNIFDENTFMVEDEKPLSFGKVSLISLGIAIVAYALFVAFDLMFVVPADVRGEVVNLIIK